MEQPEIVSSFSYTFLYFSLHGNSIIDGSRRWKIVIKLFIIRAGMT